MAIITPFEPKAVARLTRWVALATLVLATGLTLAGKLPAAAGLLAGGTVALVNLRLLLRSTTGLLQSTDRRLLVGRVLAGFFLRFALVAMVMLAAAMLPQLSLLAVASGLTLHWLAVALLYLEHHRQQRGIRERSGVTPTRPGEPENNS